MVCYKAGYSIYAIAKLMSVSPSTIRHHLQKMRIAIRKAEAYRVQPKAIKVRKPRKKK
jgi:intein-encoded DNA endonuclease-like protein